MLKVLSLASCMYFHFTHLTSFAQKFMNKTLVDNFGKQKIKLSFCSMLPLFIEYLSWIKYFVGCIDSRENQDTA